VSNVVEFRNFNLGFKDDEGKAYNLLNDVSFEIKEGVALGVVGESGCGKSMLSLSILRLLPEAAVVQSGDILYKGDSILDKSISQLEEIRGKHISMIFQEPMTALNPVYTIGFQIGEALKTHYPKLDKKKIKEAVIDQLNKVGIPNPEARFDQYPHQFSGGMRQRAMIAMAMICNPQLLIADEPTTALDVTIQAQVLELMKKIKLAGSLLLVTHNLGVVAELCNEVIVMYAGCIVEKGDIKKVFKNPMHPYTKGLIAAVPGVEVSEGDLYTIPGTVPTIDKFENGCRFAPRCEYMSENCKGYIPTMKKVSENHYVQCFLYDGKGDN